MAETYVGRHRRPDGEPADLLLAFAVAGRRASGCTHTRAASEEAAR